MLINPKSGKPKLLAADFEVIERAVRLAAVIQSWYEGPMRISANQFEQIGNELIMHMGGAQADQKFAPGQKKLPGMDETKEKT